MKSNRRQFLKTVPVASGVGALCGTSTQASAAGVDTRDRLAELGVQTIINACGVYTALTGSLLHPEALKAMGNVSKKFCRLEDLHVAVGNRIAKRIGCEAAVVTSGAAAALVMGTAACVGGRNPAIITRLPDTTGLRNEVIVQKSHRNLYDHGVRNVGVTLIEVETVAQLEKAVNPRTAMMLFLNKAEPQGQIKAAEFVALGRKHKIPTFMDAAADVPPVENLYRMVKLGFDLVTFSGGKGIRGPQSAGLLFGRRDLIDASRLHTGAASDSVARPMKVSKEEIVGMMVALEIYLDRDHKADWKRWEHDIDVISRGVQGVPGLKTEPYIPVIANQVPHLRLTWDRAALSVSRADVIGRLRAESPAIEVTPEGEGQEMITLSTWMLEPGEGAIVAKRLRTAFMGATKASI